MIIDLLKAITSKIAIPIIASGGAGKLEDFYNGAKKAMPRDYWQPVSFTMG